MPVPSQGHYGFHSEIHWKLKTKQHELHWKLKTEQHELHWKLQTEQHELHWKLKTEHVILRISVSDYPFSIFKLFLKNDIIENIIKDIFNLNGIEMFGSSLHPLCVNINMNCN
jgi:hypothetical protein